MLPIDKSHAVLTGAVAYFAVQNLTARVRAFKAAKAYLTARKEYEDHIAAQEAQLEYLCHLLNENDIPMTEFDMIALQFAQE